MMIRVIFLVAVLLIAAPAPRAAEKDGAPMVLVPAGPFRMGTSEEDIQKLLIICHICGCRRVGRG